jgi:hypothetical protein
MSIRHQRLDWDCPAIDQRITIDAQYEVVHTIGEDAESIVLVGIDCHVKRKLSTNVESELCADCESKFLRKFS